MKIHKEARKAAKTLFAGSFHEGRLDEDKVRLVIKAVAEKKPRHFLEILQSYQRSIRLELEKRSALVESATVLDKETRDSLRRTLRSKYGKDLAIEFETTPELIGGLRIKIGSDVLDSTVQARIQTLENELLHA
jgi:F-type H+-transporting ATPase subunit delta